MDDSITLAVCTDEAYALYAAMALRSAALSVAGERKIEGYYVDCGVESTTRKRVERALDIRNLNLRWENVDTRNFHHLPHSGWTSRAAFGRLCVPYLVSGDTSHFIYLDSDILVLRDISQLWKKRNNKYILSACRDYKYPKVKHTRASKTLIDLGMSPKDEYFNSGLLIVNKEKWINNSVSVMVCRLAEKYGEYFTHKDQDPLNIVVKNRWNKIDNIWNITTYEYTSRKMYNKEKYALHFTEEKPDEKGCRHPERWKYLCFVLRSEYFSPLEGAIWIVRIITSKLIKETNDIVNYVTKHRYIQSN